MRWALALLLLTPAARADNAGDALKLLDQGISEFQAGRLEAARDAFVRARDLVPDKANPHRWLGLVYARLGKCTQAVVELDAFIKRVAASDARTVEAVTLRDRCQAELKPRFGALVVESTPPEASVRLDDVAAPVMGTTPWRSEAVPAGSHLVVVHKPGFQLQQKGVMVAEEGITRVQLELVPEAEPLAERPRSKKPRYWIYGVAAGAVVVAAVVLGVGLGVGLSDSSSGIRTLDPIGR